MHHTCVVPTEPGGDQQCPICKTEIRLQKEIVEEAADERRLPFWHEAEVGAPIGRRYSATALLSKPWMKQAKTRLPAGLKRPPFPSLMWPTVDEARLHGYETVKDWYVCSRRADEEEKGELFAAANIHKWESEFVELENRFCTPDLEDQETVHASYPACSYEETIDVEVVQASGGYDQRRRRCGS